MAELNIFRPPTKEEQQNMKIIGKRSPQDEFVEKVYSEKAKAAKKDLPFADQVATEEWNESHRQEGRRLNLKYGKGYLTNEAIKEYKHPTLDWEKYSDLKNFDLIREREVKDDDLSKRHNLPIKRKLKVYRYKNYNKTYTMMNSEHEAFMDAKKLHDDIWRETRTVPEVSGSGRDKTKNRK